MATFTVSPAAPGGAGELAGVLGQLPFFAERLDAQARAEGVLLVGRLDGVPVADVWVSFSPAPETAVTAFLPGVPILIHLEVAAPVRNRGYGSTLVGAAETLVRRRGHDRVCLGVARDNPAARRLYERLGYAVWPHGWIDTGYHHTGADGVRRWYPETVTMLVKTLTAGSGNPSPVR